MRFYCNGCYIVRQRLENGKWAWVVDEFDGDTYFGDETIDARHYWSDDKEHLIGKEDEE